MNQPLASLRMGILGAARIAPFSLIKQARLLPEVDVVAVAEEYQDQDYLAAYAARHDIPRTYRSFKELLAAPDIEAVYVPLPINFHAHWVKEAIAAGKHVLCEKPMAANADEVSELNAAAAQSGLVVAEAMHCRYHPMINRLGEILASGEIGDVQSVKANFSAYIPFDNFRMHYPLGGGCTIDMGCYPITVLRAVLGVEPEVLDARAGLVADKKVDGWMKTTLAFPPGPSNASANPTSVDMFAGMRSLRLPLSIKMVFKGTKGRLSVLNYIKPEVYHHMIIRGTRGFRIERVPGESTYKSQLAAFVRAVRAGKPPITDVEDALKNMRVIDAIYEAAGLPRRGL